MGGGSPNTTRPEGPRNTTEGVGGSRRRREKILRFTFCIRLCEGWMDRLVGGGCWDTTPVQADSSTTGMGGWGRDSPKKYYVVCERSLRKY